MALLDYKSNFFAYLYSGVVPFFGINGVVVFV